MEGFAQFFGTVAMVLVQIGTAALLSIVAGLLVYGGFLALVLGLEAGWSVLTGQDRESASEAAAAAIRDRDDEGADDDVLVVGARSDEM